MNKLLKISVLLANVVLVFASCNMRSEVPLASEMTIDSIVVEKTQRKMSVYSHGTLQKTYKVALGGDPIGHKQKEGDGRTPEGRYTINDKNPKSQYHKNLGVSYPNVADRARAKAAGYPPGGDIKIHGLEAGMVGSAHTLYDWTEGCIAVTNEEIDELFAHVPTGTPILILP